MKILIDADGCPVTDLSVQTAKKFNLSCVILSDTSHTFESDYATCVTVSKGADSVDFALVNMIEPGDIVVTQDYGLAAMALAKKAAALNQNGLIYNSDNIDALLLSRHTAKKIRNSGGRLKGPKKREKSADSAFLFSLKQLITNNTAKLS